MSADGTGILANDLACDVHDDFFELYDGGADPTAAEAEILTRFAGEILSGGNREVVLAALAECLWSVGHPVEELRTRLATLVAADAGAEHWGDLYPARKRVLVRFLAKLAAPKPAPVGRKKARVPKKRLFEAGDYLAFVKRSGRVVPVIVWWVEARPPLRYDFVFPNMSRPAGPDLVARLLDTTALLTDDELGVFLGKGQRPKVVTLEHVAARPYVGRFRRFGSRPFRFPAWQCGACGYCANFEGFEQYADEGGSRGLTPDELAAIGGPPPGTPAPPATGG
ncbi:hypothetical protein J0H58_16785 [bacterium]|nr:hypothetical protein [bacterium]